MRTMPVSFNVTISLPCENLHLDAFDYEGNQQAGGRHDIRRQRIDENGIAIGDHKDWLTVEHRREKDRAQRILDGGKRADYCGSCYGAGKKGQCCNSCDDVIAAHKARGLPIDPAESYSRWQQCASEGYANLGKESCVYWGSLRVARVPGVLFFTLIHDIKPGSKKTHDISRISRSINLSHTIRQFEFGTPVPGTAPPLDGVTVLQAEKGHVAYNYQLSVVPMRWLSRRGFEVNTFKYSAAFSLKNITARISRDVPGIYFRYDIAPFAVISKETAYTLWQFVTSVCAIVGGAFTCALFADQFLYRTMSSLEAKIKIGKDQ
jgi:hypothetical protein